MPPIDRAEAADVPFNGVHDAGTEGADLRVGPCEQRPIGLRPAAYRLANRVAMASMKRTQSVTEGRQLGTSLEFVGADQAGIAF